MSSNRSFTYLPKRTRKKFSAKRLLKEYRLPVLFVLALILTLLIGSFSTHPGVHLGLITVFLDIWLVVRWFKDQRPRETYITLIIGFVINLLALIAVNQSDSVELWVTCLYIFFMLGLLTLDSRK